MTSYKYTVGNSVLTKEQRDFYEENGYLVFRHLVSDDIIEQCRYVFIY